jgi:pilus assembly protein CpaE
MGATEEDGEAGGQEKKSLLGNFDFKSLLAKKEHRAAPESAPAQ